MRLVRIPALLAALSILWLAGCGSSVPPAAPIQVVFFSDVHFDPFYDTQIFGALVAAPAEEWESIFERSTVTAVSIWPAETNYPLLVKALAAVGERSASSPFLIFGGDMLTHSFSDTFYRLYQAPDAAAMRQFKMKTVSFFARKVRASVGSTPVVFTLGNNDAYEANYMLEPNGAFLADTADLLYRDLLAGSADLASYRQTYTAGGYYAAEPAGGNLIVVGLNSIFLSPRSAPGIEGAVQAELDWLETTLAGASLSGKRVWIVMHIPPGADIFTTKDLVDAQGQIGSAAMGWKADPQARFLRILAAYPEIVSAMFAGHTHMDEYRLPFGLLEVSPSVSPVFGNDPAFKTFTVSDGGDLLDYTSTNLALGRTDATFATSYTFSTTYPVSGILQSALPRLFPLLVSSPALEASYRLRYYSGHDAASPITDRNWPVYWCGIAAMAERDVVDCVNGY